jgi:NhaP-type Na+/H+ or K+/H+ antiporter
MFVFSLAQAAQRQGWSLQVAVMKEVGATKRLEHLVDGESLVNDGSAYVFFLIFFELLKGTGRSPMGTVGYFFQLVIVASLVGLAFGLLLHRILAMVYRCVLQENINTE